MPTAAPCSARAANSSPTPCAARNNPVAPAAITRPARITQRPANVVRHRPEHQQGDQEQESVGREDDGQRDRQPPLGLVDAIQRRRGRRREEQQEGPHAGHQPERGRPRQRGPPRIPPGGQAACLRSGSAAAPLEPPVPLLRPGPARPTLDVQPDRLISERTSVVVGDTEFVLIPVRGGETSDPLMVYLPASGLLFTEKASLMSYLGVPSPPRARRRDCWTRCGTVASWHPGSSSRVTPR